jgi:uncharacterized protein (DUF488 family)
MKYTGEFMKIYTIGFTKKNAERFFSLLKDNEISTMIDVRLNAVSQLAGFAKQNDLQFFLSKLCEANYFHAKELAPTKEILNDYKKKIISWQEYEKRYIELLSKREVEKTLDDSLFEKGCLLCSEHEPSFCHRRLALEYLKSHWNLNFEINHLI